MVLLDGHVAVAVAVAGAVAQGGAEDEEEAVVKSYLPMILMLIWRSITRKPCKKTENSSCVY